MVDSNLDLDLDLDLGQGLIQIQGRDHIHLSPLVHQIEKYLRLYLSPIERTTTPVSTRGPRATLAHRVNRLGQRQLEVRHCIETT